MNLRTLLREPLLHFLLIGLALFALYGRASPGDADSRRIVVSQSQVDDIVRQYQATWQRPPSSTELMALIDTYVRDEIAYREGLSMGLDKDDAVIKRRVRQKYELIAEESERSGPNDADLAAYYKANPARFVRPVVVSFDQIFFDPGSNTPEAVGAVKAALAKGADPGSFGQASMLPRQVDGSSLDLVARDFGDGFARHVGVAPVGTWAGPVASGFGVHLLRVRARFAPTLPPLDRVRTAVAREWENERRTRSSDAEYRRLRAEYDVVITAKVPPASQP